MRFASAATIEEEEENFVEEAEIIEGENLRSIIFLFIYFIIEKFYTFFF